MSEAVVPLRRAERSRSVRRTETVFQWQPDAPGPRQTLCGGGHYDNRVGETGGRGLPAVGRGLGGSLAGLYGVTDIDGGTQVIDTYRVAERGATPARRDAAIGGPSLR